MSSQVTKSRRMNEPRFIRSPSTKFSSSKAIHLKVPEIVAKLRENVKKGPNRYVLAKFSKNGKRQKRPKTAKNDPHEIISEAVVDLTSKRALVST